MASPSFSRSIVPSRRQWLLIFFGTALWTLFIHIYGSQHHTFKSKWQDNVSNLSATALFSLITFDIYKKPIQESVIPLSDPKLPIPFQSDVEPSQWFLHPKLGPTLPLFFVWPNVPRPYPVGAWLWYAPYSWMVYGAGVSLSAATLVMAFIFGLTAHLCFFLFFNSLSLTFQDEWREKKFSFLKVSLIFLYLITYLEFIWWSGQGQYDLIAMLPLFVAIAMFHKKHYTRSIFFFAIALNFHFRVLFSLGLLLISIFHVLRVPKKNSESIFRWNNWRWNLPSVALGAFAAQIFLWNSKFITDSNLFRLNEYHYRLLMQKPSWEVLVFIFIGLGLPLWLAYKKLWELFITISIALMIMFTSPQICGWYVLFLFPTFLLISKNSLARRTSYYAVLIFYIFSASTFMKESPFDLHIFREIVESLQGQTYG